jgi:(+)-trans-carveol dehydrogenase
MKGKCDGKVALVTGAARGQGRSHAVRLAEEGADIIAVDICAQIESVPIALATPEDLAETASMVEGLDRRIVALEADVRDFDTLKRAVDTGVAEFGRLDIVAANAGVIGFGLAEEISAEAWSDVIGVNLTGVWHTAKAAIPHMKSRDGGGSIVITSSTAGTKIVPGIAAYAASKMGVIALMRVLASELGPY